MNWLEPVDLYCERTGPGLGAEPLNAVTNFAFIIMALVLWAQFARTRPVQSQARVLAALMAIVGLGSGSLHTFAVRLTALLDILGILIFIMYFIALYVRQVLRQNMWVNLLISIAWFVASGLAATQISPTSTYVPAWLILCVFAGLAYRSHQPGRAWLAGAAAVFVFSVTFRALDHELCDVFPRGTHFMWHLCNAAVLYMASRGLCEALAGSARGRPDTIAAV